MALQPFRDEQLNYFRFAFLVINEFPKALRQTFSTMWDNSFGHLTGYQRWDDTTAVRSLFLSTEGGKTRVPINLSFDEWDCTALFQATIYARTFASPDSKGHPRTLSQLYVSKLPHGKFHVSVESPGGNDAETFSLAIDQLRLLRNSLCHSPSSKIDKMTFDQWVQHAKDAFKALGVETDPVEAIGRLTDADFPTEKVRALEEDIRKASQAENQFLREEVKDRLLDVRSDIAQSIQQLQDSHKRTETERKKEVQSLNDKLQLVKEELKEEIRNTMEKSKEESEEKPAVNQEVTGRTTLALCTCLTVLQSEVQNCVYLDQEKAFKVCWAYNETTDIINFALEVTTLGWVGFGFAHKIHRMQNYDVIVGKIQDGKESLTDRFTSGCKEPLADLSQDYTLTGFNESNGKTFLEFHRKRNTGDKKDIEIKPGPMLLVYAYHSLDYPAPYETKHQKQGSKLVTLIPSGPSKPEKPTSGVSENSITSQNNQMLTTASSSANNTVGDPVQRSSSSNIRVSVVFTVVFSSCNLIFTASTFNFFLRVI